MSTFDAYHKWLGIPPTEQPPHHYRLLGIAPFEADLDVIESAADRQMTYIRQCATGQYVKESQQILNELSAARVCLLNPSKKKAYDSELEARINAAPLTAAPNAAATEAPSRMQPEGGITAANTPDGVVPAEVAQQERRARKLLDEQDYDAAIPLLVKLRDLQAGLFKDTSAWAKAELPIAKQKQEKLRARVSVACDKARKHLKEYHYGEATEILEGLPIPARTDEARRLLLQASEAFDDSMGLQKEIDAALKAKNYDHLLPLVKRYVKLKPDNAQMQRLAKDLARNRADRAVRNYKGTGKYFDVAGRLVEPKEIAGGLFFIVALVVGVSYGAKYLHKIPAANDIGASQPPPNATADRQSNKAEETTSRLPDEVKQPATDNTMASARWPAGFSRHFGTRPTGRFLTTFDRQTGAIFWDSNRGLLHGSTFPARPRSQLLCMDVSPDEQFVATAFRSRDDRKSTIIVWDLTSGSVKRTIEGLLVDINRLAWHPSGKLFASGASDGQVSFWGVERDRPFSWSPGLEHPVGVTGLTFHPKVSSLVSTSLDGYYKIWYLPEDIDAVRGPIGSSHTFGNYPYGTLGTGYDVTGDQLIVRGDTLVDVWNFPGAGPSIRVSVPGATFAWAPGGKSFVTAGGAGMEMEAKRWETESGKMLAHYRGGCTQPITTVAFSPSGKLLFTDGGEVPFVVWDVASGAQIPDPASALKADWGPVVAASPPSAFVPVEKAALAIRPGGQRLARVAVAQCHPFTIAETGLWDDIPASLHEATVYEPPLAGKSQSRNVVEVDVLEGGALALAAAWGTEPGDPASSINDPDLVTEQQLTARGWKPTGTITRTYPGGAPDKQRIFAREVKTGEKLRLATRNVTPPFVIIGDVKLRPNAGGTATSADTKPTTPASPQSASR